MTNTPHLPEPLLNSDEAGRVLGLKGSTLAIWRARKLADQPRYLKVNRLVRYRPSDLAEWLHARNCGPHARATGN